MPDIPTRSIDIRPDRDAAPETIEIAVVGAGGHGRELADIVRAVATSTGAVALLGLCDDGTPDRLALARSSMQFLGDRSALDDRDVHVHLGLGYPAVREQVDIALGQRPARPLQHPTATMGSGCALSEGVVLAQRATVTTNVRLGRHTHINVAASVSHDCVVGDYVTICPGATITGSVSIGSGVFVGAGATLLPGISVGARATIGAGAVVVDDVAPGAVVAGVPAREISQR